MNSRGRYFLVAAAFLLGAGFTGCTKAPDPWKDAKTGQKRILVTFPALFCLTHAVAGDDAFVLSCLSTEGAHDHTSTPADIIKAKGSELLIYNGLGLDNIFVEKLRAAGKVETLCVGEMLPESMILPMGEEEEHGPGEEHHHHGPHDPHIWLGPPQAMAIADAIGKKLAAIDPAHADGYAQRAEKLKLDLKQLHEDGLARFKVKSNRKVLSMHDSMGYFVKAFGLEPAGCIQSMPGLDPAAARLGQLVNKCKEQKVTVITFEPVEQSNKTQPELVQKELKSRGADVTLVEFDPLEVAPLAKDSVNPDPAYYMQKMRANIDNLAKALP